MARILYTKEQIAYLRSGYKKWMIGDLTKNFNRRFGLDKTRNQIRSCLRNHAIVSGRKSGSIAGYSDIFTPAQVRFIKKNYVKMSARDLGTAVNEKYGLSVTVGQVKAFVKNHRISSGRTGQFTAGNVPWNTGTKGKMGSSENRGSFVKGHTPKNTRPLGSERKCPKDGFILVKVEEECPFTGRSTRFKHKHVVVWEAKNGPLPTGHVVRFIDGDPTNCDIDNLIMVSRAEHLRLNQFGFKHYPDEIKPSLVAIAKLDVATYSRSKEETV